MNLCSRRFSGKNAFAVGTQVPYFVEDGNFGINFRAEEIVNKLLSEYLMWCGFWDADSINKLA